MSAKKENAMGSKSARGGHRLGRGPFGGMVVLGSIFAIGCGSNADPPPGANLSDSEIAGTAGTTSTDKPAGKPKGKPADEVTDGGASGGNDNVAGGSSAGKPSGTTGGTSGSVIVTAGTGGTGSMAAGGTHETGSDDRPDFCSTLEGTTYTKCGLYSKDCQVLTDIEAGTQCRSFALVRSICEDAGAMNGETPDTGAVPEAWYCTWGVMFQSAMKDECKSMTPISLTPTAASHDTDVAFCQSCIVPFVSATNDGTPSMTECSKL
jgi:hypothetical protein